MKKLFLLLIVALMFSCKEESSFIPRDFNKVEFETILADSTLSIRAIDILNDGSLAFAANNNTFGLYNEASNVWNISKQEYDSLDIEFRAVAHTSTDFFMLSVASPALLFKTTQAGMQLVYQEEHEKAFYDSMTFWNDQEGIAMGDPTNSCISIIITRDGGKTWTKIPCEELPEAIEGEAAFAASDTNITVYRDHTWIATGGMASNILYSPDKGKNWQLFETPIIQGTSTKGMYSVDFYDELNGFAIGGDYTNPDGNTNNKILTNDGGRTWEIVANGQTPNYRSCVQYVPNREGMELVTVGFKGIDFSNDGGKSWKHISDEGFYTVRFINDSTAYAAGSKRISKLHFKE
ncbi:oxidoreductase [Flavobacteriaceae sp. LMIT009]